LTSSHDSISDLDLIALHADTFFVLGDSGRILSENKPDTSGGPRFYLAGCETGNVFQIHRDVDDAVAHELQVLAADEPPLFDSNSEPLYLGEYLELLSPTEDQVGQGLNYVFPVDFSYETDKTLVISGTPEGDQLVAELETNDSIPEGLKSMGFRTPSDIWSPLCIGLHEGKIAAIGETVRIGKKGVEVGVDTVPDLRGRGFGAAATAGWALHPDIKKHVRFYGHAKSNNSSKRVTERLALRYIGASLLIR